MYRIIFLLFCVLFSITVYAQVKPVVIQEIALPDGRIILIYDNGTWKEKEYTYPVIEWVNVPAGKFTMGSPTTEFGHLFEIQHVVTLHKFQISKYEITFDQYDLFCEQTNREKPDDAGFGRGNRPVINVSCQDAAAFAKWIGCRLPTESEWEYACRAGTTTTFNTGNCLSTDQANYNGYEPFSACSRGEYRNGTMPVGSFPPNAWGIYDMHGNVFEWCSDYWGQYTSAPLINPTGPPTGQYSVIRGGSWRLGATYCRSAQRDYSACSFKTSSMGFRIVKDSH